MLKLQYFGHLMQGADSLEKTLMLGKIEGRKRRGQQRTRWLDGITDSMDLHLSKFWMVKDREARSAAVHGVTKSRTRLSDLTFTFSFNTVLPMNIQDRFPEFPVGLTGLISLLSKGLSRIFSNTTVQKHQFFGTQLSSQSNSHIHT